MYAHLYSYPSVKTGDSVEYGQVLGKLGNTGKYSDGVHLHFAIGTYKNGNFTGVDKYGKEVDSTLYINPNQPRKCYIQITK